VHKPRGGPACGAKGPCSVSPAGSSIHQNFVNLAWKQSKTCMMNEIYTVHVWVKPCARWERVDEERDNFSTLLKNRVKLPTHGLDPSHPLSHFLQYFVRSPFVCTTSSSLRGTLSTSVLPMPTLQSSLHARWAARMSSSNMVG